MSEKQTESGGGQGPERLVSASASMRRWMRTRGPRPGIKPDPFTSLRFKRRMGRAVGLPDTSSLAAYDFGRMHEAQIARDED